MTAAERRYVRAEAELRAALLDPPEDFYQGGLSVVCSDAYYDLVEAGASREVLRDLYLVGRVLGDYLHRVRSTREAA